jgi:hypothetical protein
VTEDEAFKQLAVETLGGFGWSITPEEIGDFADITIVFSRLIPWWNGLDQDTRDLIGEFDLAPGLWNKGWLSEWPALYTLLAGNAFGRFGSTLDDIRASLVNAQGRAPDYAAQHAVGRLEDDPAFQTDDASSQ